MAATTPDHATPVALRPGEFGPTVAGGKPRSGGPDWIRLGMVAVSLVTSFMVLTGGYYGFLIWKANNDLSSGVSLVDLPSFDPVVGETALPAVETVELEDRKTILLIGSDSREGLSREQLAQIGTENVGTDLTDTIILLQVDPNTDAAAMLSFPRDLLVERCNGTTGKINEAFFIGEQQEDGLGPACLVSTIENLTQIHIDHYARVNFAGFVRAVDALGGVTFYVEEPMRDAWSGLDIPSGCVEFDGVSAIQFVRARHIDSDFGRIARQQRFAREMIKKATSLGTLLNPATVTSLVGSVSETLETDAEFGLGDMIDLVNSVKNISSGAVDGRTVPGVVGRWGEASVVRLVEDEAEVLFEAFRNGDLLPEGVGTDAAPIELGPANVIPVEVVNGGAAAGTADETAEVLEALGYTVSGTDQTANYGFANSTILYPENRQDHAELLAEALDITRLTMRTDDEEQLQLLLGTEFDPAEYAPPPPAPGEPPAETATPVPEATEQEFVGAALSEVTC